MPSNPARSRPPTRPDLRSYRERRKPDAISAILTYPGVNLLDISGPAQVLKSVRDNCRQNTEVHEIVCVSNSGGTITTDTGISICTVSFSELSALYIDNIIIPGGPGVWNALDNADIVSWIIERSSDARRIAAVCIGAFLLGRSGLLDGRSAVTHWGYCERLSRDFPSCRIQRDQLFQKDGNVWTSAGVSAGIDLALAIVEEDYGHLTALDIARRLVVFLKRPGGQNQFSSLLKAQISGSDQRIETLHAWIAENLSGNLNVERLADRLGMSLRNFSRFYRSRTGISPAVAVEMIRIEAAQLLLESASLSIATVAKQTGFGDDERMRRAFVRQLGVSPAVYRERFSACR